MYTNLKCVSESLITALVNMSLLYRWNCLVQETGGHLPATLKPFQLETVTLLAAGKSVLAAVPTAQGKTLMQLHGSRVIGGETMSYCHFIRLTLIVNITISVNFITRITKSPTITVSNYTPPSICNFIGLVLNASITSLYCPNVTDPLFLSVTTIFPL